MKVYFHLYFGLDDNNTPIRVTAFIKHRFEGQERKFEYTADTEEHALDGLNKLLTDLEIEL